MFSLDWFLTEDMQQKEDVYLLPVQMYICELNFLSLWKS